MIKKIVKILLIIFFFLSLILFYLSILGVETEKFNNQIKNRISEINKDIILELESIKITLIPFNLKANIITQNAKITLNDKKINLKSLKTKISLLDLLKNKFSINNLQVSSESIKLKNLVSVIKFFKNEQKLYLLEEMIEEGYIGGNIDLNFDKEGNLKNDYKIIGFAKDLKVKTLKNYNLDKLNFVFDVKEKNYKFSKIHAQLNKIKISSPLITLEDKSNFFLLKGKILNNKKNIPINAIGNLLGRDFKNLDLKDLHLISDNDISIKISKKFKIDNFNINSEINLSNLTYKNKYKSIQKYFPEIKELIGLKDHKIKLNHNKGITKIVGTGKILIGDNEDKINYEITKKNKKLFFKNELEVKKSLFSINELKYKKEKNIKSLIKVKGILSANDIIFFNEISLIENNNKILIKNLSLDDKLKINNIDSIKLDYKNYDKIYNQIYLKKNKNNYTIEGSSFDASKIINDIMENKEDDLSIFSNLNSKIDIKIKKIYIDDVYFVNNLIGSIDYKSNKIDNLNLVSIFTNKKKLILSIKTNKKDEKITTLTAGYPTPLIKRYKFIKGFEGGILDFYSVKKNKTSNSLLVIENFKIKEVPIFAKLLSLASLQGIADLLTGDGIRFTDFEMKFTNKKGLMTIEEMYAIGPAVSILMDGYIDKKNLISLRGTLVPATTINRSIASIPLLGKILIGDKIGEGVFGVSFKVKGAPKKLKTTVNPIKSLTPRFIVRTLEKLKKN